MWRLPWKASPGKMMTMQQPPQTGNQEIDDALARVADADDVDQARVLGEAQAVLQAVLRNSRED